MNDKSQYIVVFGGTGYYGRKVVEKLIQKGQSVRVVSRNSEAAKIILGDKVDIYEGDVTNRSTIIGSLKNAKCIVICLSAMTNKLIRKMKAIERDAVLNIMEEAEKAQISRLIYMSGYEMRAQLLDELNIPEFGAIKIEIESRITQSAFNWTILGDAPAFELFFRLTNKGKMTVPGGGFRPVPTISAEDVGEITAQIAMRNDLGSKRIKLTGPEALSFPEAAKRMSQLTGKKIRHIAIPLFMVNIISIILIPFAPFVRYLYKSLKMLNNFPEDLAVDVPNQHRLLRSLFDYEPVSFDMEIQKRMKENRI